jgi:hypothetical protein
MQAPALLWLCVIDMKFHMSSAAGLKSSQFNRKRNSEKANIE